MYIYLWTIFVMSITTVKLPWEMDDVNKAWSMTISLNTPILSAVLCCVVFCRMAGWGLEQSSWRSACQQRTSIMATYTRASWGRRPPTRTAGFKAPGLPTLKTANHSRQTLISWARLVFCDHSAMTSCFIESDASSSDHIVSLGLSVLRQIIDMYIGCATRLWWHDLWLNRYVSIS